MEVRGRKILLFNLVEMKDFNWNVKYYYIILNRTIKFNKNKDIFRIKKIIKNNLI